MLNPALRRDFPPLCSVPSSLFQAGVSGLTLEWPHIPPHSLDMSEKTEEQGLCVSSFFVLHKR